MAMPISSGHDVEDEERPESNGAESTATPLQNLQVGPGGVVDVGSSRLPQNGTDPETSADERKLCQPSPLTGRVVTRFPASGSATSARGETPHLAAETAGMQRPGSRARGRRRKGGRGERGKERDWGNEGKNIRPHVSPSPLQLKQSWHLVPSRPSSPSPLTGAHSIYSLGGTGGRPPDFGVITGPFTNRQGTFKERNIRPRTADGSTSPTRSAVAIFVTTRSKFDFSGQKRQAVGGSVASGGDENRRRQRKCFTSKPHRRGNSDGKDREGLAYEGGSISVVSGKLSSDENTMRLSGSPSLKGGGEAAVHEKHKPSLTAGGLASVQNLRSARRQQLQVLRGASSSVDYSSNLSGSFGHRGVGRVRARTAAARRKELAVVGACAPEDLILSPERAAARLAGIRKAYGLQNAIPFRASSLHATALKSAPS